MVKNTYACTSCKKTFSRKYDAERHNKLKHNEMAVVYNKEIDWISNKRKTNVKSQQIQHDPSSSPSSPSSSSFLSTTSTSETDNKNTASKPYYDFLKDFNFKDRNSEINKNTDIEKIFKIFEKISPLIDELDTQLTAYKPHEERIKILSEAIIFSLMSFNPVHSKRYNQFASFNHGITKSVGICSTFRQNSTGSGSINVKNNYFGCPVF